MVPRHLPAARSLFVLAAIAGLAGVASRDMPAAAEERWPADEVLRTSMATIRKATLDNHTLVTHRRMPPQAAQRFFELISKETGRIKAEARISAEARPVLERLLADIAAGGEAVAGRGEMTPIDGILQIDAALGRYPQNFDDPTWQPLR